MMDSSHLPDSYRACRELAARSAVSFRAALWMLPGTFRDDFAALYAFSRLADDIADGDFPLEEKRERLAMFRRAFERHRANAPDPPDPFLTAFVRTIERRQIPLEDVEALLAGVEMDFSTTRYPTFEALSVYCDRVAGSVGRICLSIFDARGAGTLAIANDLGLAMQLTNILRDVAEDAGRGRIYLPLEGLAAFGVSEGAVLALDPEEGFPELVRFEVRRARAFFESARALPPLLPRQVRFFPESLAGAYESVLDRIERGGCDPVRRPIRRGWLGPARLALASWLRHRFG